MAISSPGLEKDVALLQDQTEGNVFDAVDDFTDFALGVDQGVDAGVQGLLFFDDLCDGGLHGGDVTGMGDRFMVGIGSDLGGQSTQIGDLLEFRLDLEFQFVALGKKS